MLAGLLKDQRVIVSGEFDGKQLRVASLKADPAEQPGDQSVVNATGKLRWRIYKWATGELLAYCDELPSNFSRSWGCAPVLAIAGKHHPLNMKDNSQNAPWRSLLGKPVRITGSFKNGEISVDSLERVFGSWVHKSVHIEVKGRLTCQRIHPELMIWPPRRTGPEWSIHAAGQSYTLTFTDKSLEQKATQLQDQTVLLKGTLVNGSITVTSIESVG